MPRASIGDERTRRHVEERERLDVRPVVLGLGHRRAEVGDAQLRVAQHERAEHFPLRHRGRDVGAPREVRHAEPVVRAQQQRAPVGERIRAGVLVAGAGVEPQQEQVRREQRVQPADRRARSRRRRSARTAPRSRRRTRGTEWPCRRCRTPGACRRRSGTRPWRVPRTRRSSRAGARRRPGRACPAAPSTLRPIREKFGTAHRCTGSICVVSRVAGAPELLRRRRRG